MNDIYIIGGAVLLVLAGFFVIPFLQKKGLLTSKNIETIMSLCNIERLLIDILPIADQYKNEANFALNVADEVIDYVNTYANGTLSEAEKITLSLKLVNDISNKFKVQISDNELRLIEIIIEQGIKHSDKVIASTPVK